MSPPAVPSLHPHRILRQHSSSSSSSSIGKSLSISQQLVKVQTQPSMDLSHPSSNYSSSSSYYDDDAYSLPLVGRNWGSHAAAATTFKLFNPLSAVASIFRSFIPALQSLLVPTCHLLAVSPVISSNSHRSSGGRKRLLTGTFFGQKKGRVSFAVQEAPRSEPILLLELAIPTSHLVKEMASGMVRILLECDRNNHSSGRGRKKPALWDEPLWTMFCNGRKLGYATARDCTSSDFHLLRTVQTVSAGAGVIPSAATPPQLPPPTPRPVTSAAAAAATPPGPAGSPMGAAKNSNDDSPAAAGGGAHPEIMYMRAKFDRVIGNRDSEALYMINPDCTRRGDGGKFNNGGPELSIFLLRI